MYPHKCIFCITFVWYPMHWFNLSLKEYPFGVKMNNIVGLCEFVVLKLWIFLNFNFSGNEIRLPLFQIQTWLWSWSLNLTYCTLTTTRAHTQMVDRNRYQIYFHGVCNYAEKFSEMGKLFYFWGKSQPSISLIEM